MASFLPSQGGFTVLPSLRAYQDLLYSNSSSTHSLSKKSTKMLSKLACDLFAALKGK